MNAFNDISYFCPDVNPLIFNDDDVNVVAGLYEELFVE
jgi:hypothetical protein